MSVLKQCIVRCVGGEGGAALGRSLVGHALDALRECATHPGPRAVACVLETTHPYQNKMVSTHITRGMFKPHRHASDGHYDSILFFLHLGCEIEPIEHCDWSVASEKRCIV